MPHDQRYTYSGMYMLYTQVMELEKFETYPKMTADSFERLLRAWSSLDGGWLQKEGRGANAVFFRREPEDKILKIINRSKDFGKRVSNKVRAIISTTP